MPPSNIEKENQRESAAGADTIDNDSRVYVAQWNHLVSCTNWEKGRIICQWRSALAAAGAPSAEYSDEAWSRRVGGVSPQHVGRLRRVFERFAEVYREYPSLYWSHFCAALDWDDAEMWLEGAVQNRWSVAQMRRKRSEVLGAGCSDGEDSPADEPVVEDEAPSEEAEPVDPQDDTALAEASSTVIQALEELACSGGQADGDDLQPAAAPAGACPASDAEPSAASAPAGKAVQELERVADLPDDLREAFEQMKVAILRHKLDGWKAVQREAILAVLDGLKQLVG